MKLFSEDIIILKKLIYDDRVDLYFFHEKYKLSPSQIVRATVKFKKLGIINLKNNHISLSIKGHNWILENRKKLFLKPRDLYWKKAPDSMLQNKLDINALYTPNVRKLDFELFDINEDGK